MTVADVFDYTAVTPSTLLQWRTDAGLTQEQAAEAFGVHHKTYNNWENGRTEVQRTKRARVAQVLGVPDGIDEAFPLSPIEQTIAGVLRAEQARKMVGQTQLAEVAGISQSQMSKVLRGTRPITIGALDRVARELGLQLRVTLDVEAASDPT